MLTLVLFYEIYLHINGFTSLTKESFRVYEPSQKITVDSIFPGSNRIRKQTLEIKKDKKGCLLH